MRENIEIANDVLSIAQAKKINWFHVELIDLNSGGIPLHYYFYWGWLRG